MNEAVDRVIEEREAMDRGFPAGIMLSGLVHLLLVGSAFAASWLGPRGPAIQVVPGFVVPLPRGGGGPVAPDPAPAVAPPVTTQAAPVPEPPAPAPPPKVIKPPKEEPRKGLPPPDAKRTKPKPEKSAAPTRYSGPPTPERTPSKAAAGGTGTAVAPGGVGIIGPAGPGVPNGTDAGGDWYLAAVQQKIWLIWTRQVKSGFTQPITVSFTILADGSLEDGSVRPVQSSGVQLLDNAALRSVFSAAPFGPFPKTYGTNRITIQALFQPTP
jgi:periplasmic protein TonB